MQREVSSNLLTIVLLLILILVFILPFICSEIEENLEFFLFVMGVLVALISGKMCKELLLKAGKEPVMIAAVVLVSGVLFEVFRDRIRWFVNGGLSVLSVRIFIFSIIITLGFLASIITAIVASLILVEIIDMVPIKRNCKVNVTIIACFAIGLGAALTPVGEPLSAIAVSKMNADFWYLFSLLGIYIIPGILAMGILGIFFVDRNTMEFSNCNKNRMIIICSTKWEKYLSPVMRACKIYLFVMALFFLGEGFSPLVNLYVLELNTRVLYWINMISAVLDNATLAAAELSPSMSRQQVQSILMGLLISGGMLIPGNVPNIISAGKLGITSREWAAIGFPVGLAMMTVYFMVLF